MNKRFPLQSVFEQRPQIRLAPQSTPIDTVHMDKESKLVLLAAVMCAVFMVACIYVVYFLGWSKPIATFVSPLGVAVTCVLQMSIVSRMDGETGRARASSLAGGFAIGYVGGMILMAIFALTWDFTIR